MCQGKRRKIIALDFDGVVVTNAWSGIGEPIMKNVDSIKEEIKNGTRVILWTCRSGDALLDAIITCWELGIPLSAVNSNLLEIMELYGQDSRKITADEYWDDKAVVKNDK